MKLKLRLRRAQQDEEREVLLFDIEAKAGELLKISRRSLTLKEDEVRLG